MLHSGNSFAIFNFTIYGIINPYCRCNLSFEEDYALLSVISTYLSKKHGLIIL